MARNENFDAVTIGKNTPETISGTGATLSFSGNDDRDIHDSTDVTLSNGTAGSVTENVAVNYYEGIDATGTLLASETQSITLAAGASSTTTFLTDDFSLGVGDYFVEVVTTNLTADGIDEHTLGAEFTTYQTDDGDLVTVDQNGRERARYDATSGTAIYPTVDAGSVTSPSIDAGSVTSQSVNADGLDVSGWNWVDVTNHGVDPTGVESVVPAINGLIADNTLLIFPPGEYFVPPGETITTVGSATQNFGMVGRGDARFVHAADSVESEWLVCRGPNGSASPIEDLYLSNLTVDFTALNCGRRMQLTASGQSVVEDVTVEGVHESKLPSSGGAAVRCVGENSVLVLDKFRLPDGAGTNPAATQAERPIGLLIPADSTSKIVVRDAHIEGWHDNGLYANKCSSPIIVERGLFKNNGRSNIRVGSPQTTVRDAKVVLDSTSWMIEGVFPIRVWENSGPVEIINPTIDIGVVDGTHLSTAIKIDGDLESATVRGGTVSVSTPCRLTRIDPLAVGVADHGVTFEDVRYLRDVEGGSYIRAIDVARDNVVLRDMQVHAQVGGATDTRGARIRTNNVRVVGGHYQADDRGIWIDGGANVVVDGVEGVRAATNAFDYAGTDGNVVNTSPGSIDGFTIRESRPRWNGIIGGGPLGGIDLSTVHGNTGGDVAMSNGVATGFPDGSLATWRGASWIRVDGQATVSPP